MSEATILWPGESGTKYKYWATPIGSSFKEEGGNYIFAKESRPGSWVAVYIGQAKNLSQRLGNHEKEACAKRNGATHIHSHTQSSEAGRLAEEEDLIALLKPACNDQLK